MAVKLDQCVTVYVLVQVSPGSREVATVTPDHERERERDPESELESLIMRGGEKVSEHGASYINAVLSRVWTHL